MSFMSFVLMIVLMAAIGYWTYKKIKNDFAQFKREDDLKKRDAKFKNVIHGLKNNPNVDDITWAIDNLVLSDTLAIKGHWRAIFELVENAEHIERNLKIDLRNTLLKCGVDLLKEVR